MRIAYLIHQYLPDHLGGTEDYTRGLARRAAADGHEVTIISAREHPGGDALEHRATEYRYDGVQVICLDRNLSLADNVALAEYDDAAMGERTRDLLADRPPDVVHVTHAMRHTSAALRVCRDLGIPVVITLCDYWFICARHTLLTWHGQVCPGPVDWTACLDCTRDLHGIGVSGPERAAVRERPQRLRAELESADRIVGLTRFARDAFEANGFPRGRIELIPHGIEAEELGSRPAPRARPEGPARFLFIGSLAPAKGPHLAVAALRARPDLDATLTIHGGARPGPYFEALAAGAERDPRVTLAGTFEPARLSAVLAGHDCLVAPSLGVDNGPMVVKQALHAGLRVIVSRIGSMVELVEEDRDGWICEPGDPGALARAMEAAAASLDEPFAPNPQTTATEHYAAVARIYAELAT
jgi:glycosyltransferase involved in cell wall biosynthesis